MRAEIIKSLEGNVTAPGVSVIDQYEVRQVSATALSLLDIIFYLIIAIMMFLCFFALQGAMSANLYE